MVNDEVSSKVINIEIRIAKLLLRAAMKAITNSGKLKNLVKKGQLENVELSDKSELKELKKLLNRYGVNFSVMKDKESGMYSLFCQAKDTKTFDFAFRNAVSKTERKVDRRQSTMKTLEVFNEKVKAMAAKGKIKKKRHEQ